MIKIRERMCPKCDECNYEDISNISLYDSLVQKCSRCDIIRVSARGYSELMYKIMYSLNIGHIKSYTNTIDLSEDSIKEIRKFMKVVDLSSFKLKEIENGKCNVCNVMLSRFICKYYKKFEIYYCIGCNSVYFTKTGLEDFVNFLQKVFTPFSFKRFLKEIFHFKKVKDNAQK